MQNLHAELHPHHLLRLGLAKSQVAHSRLELSILLPLLGLGHILGSKTVTEATASQADRLPPELLPNATEFLEHRNRWKSLALGWNGCHLCALFSVMATAC